MSKNKLECLSLAQNIAFGHQQSCIELLQRDIPLDIREFVRGKALEGMRRSMHPEMVQLFIKMLDPTRLHEVITVLDLCNDAWLIEAFVLDELFEYLWRLQGANLKMALQYPGEWCDCPKLYDVIEAYLMEHVDDEEAVELCILCMMYLGSIDEYMYLWRPRWTLCARETYMKHPNEIMLAGMEV